VSERDELLAVVVGRLEHVVAAGDLSPVREPGVLAEADRLTAVLDDRDVPARHALGWLHWYRYQAVLPVIQDGMALAAAVSMFTPCFIADVGPLPEPMLPLLADEVARLSLATLDETAGSGDLEWIDHTVALWQRIVRATPDDDPDRPGRLSNLSSVLRARFEQTRDPADLDAAITAAQAAADAAPDDDPERAVILANLANALYVRFAEAGHLTDLDADIAARRTAVEVAPADHPRRLWLLTSLADSLWDRYERVGVAADLDVTITALREAGAIIPEGDSRQVRTLDSLGRALHARFMQNDIGADLDAAITAFQAAASSAPAGDAGRATILANLGAALGDRFARAREPADLDAAIDVLQAAADATPAGHPDRPDRLANLAAAIAFRFPRTQSPADLDTVVRLLEMAADAAPDDHPARAAIVSKLTAARRSCAERMEADAEVRAADAALDAAMGLPAGQTSRVTDFSRGVSGTLAELDATIRAEQAELDAAADGDPARLVHLHGLGYALRIRYNRTGNVDDLDAAIRAMRECLTAAPADSPHRAGQHGALAEALQQRYRRRGDVADLDEAIADWTAAAAGSTEGLPWLFGLGLCLQARFRATGNPADIEAAVEARRSALAAASDDLRPSCLSDLGSALHERFLHTGDPRDLEAALAACRAAVAAMPGDHQDRGRYLSELGVVLWSWARHTGNPADLDEAVTRLRAAVDATPAGDPDRHVCLSRLCFALRERSEWAGSPADLDAAVEAARQAVEGTRPDGPERAAALEGMAHALITRFQLAGDIDDYQAALDTFHAAVAATPDGHRDQIRFVAGMAAVLLAGYQHTGDPSGLDMTIKALRAATEATPDDDPDRAVQLRNLGRALRARSAHPGNEADLDGAVEALRTAAEAAPDSYRASCLAELGWALVVRSQRTGNRDDLDAAIGALRAAADGTPEEQAERAGHLTSLGAALRTRFEWTGAEADRTAAVAAFTAAASQQAAAPMERIRAGSTAAWLLARSAPDRAVGLFEAAVALLPELSLRSLSRRDQQQKLAKIGGLAADAAAAALADAVTHPGERERAVRALRLLEAGRAVLISQALETRDDLSELRARHPGLAQRFGELRDRLDRAQDRVPAATKTVAGAGQAVLLAVAGRRRLVGDLAAILDEIRAEDGFGSFGKPPPVAELIAEAAAGPIVVCNAGSSRYDALLVTASGAGYIELPDLGRDLLTHQIASFQSAVRQASDRDLALRERVARQQQVMDILGWLWDAIAGPVLHALGIDRAPAPGEPWPRVWWVTGGMFSLLPLHAAGHHNEDHDGSAPRTVLDRIVSSYTPSIRALRHSREHAGASEGESLIVAMPATPGLPGGAPLPNVAAEARQLGNLLPAPVLLTEPRAEGAAGVPTKAAVLARLPRCAIAHFACHGLTNLNDPSQSRLLLSDHESDPLTVGSLAAVNLEHARLAYLSACGTAFAFAVKGQLLDEAIHLTSACQLAGFPHVVGTLWDINDAVSAEVAAMFYAGLRTKDGSLEVGRAARALHDAIRALRDRYRNTPSMWASYIHAGA
jgi:tetratricopeptide (TPR) repeat protein